MRDRFGDDAGFVEEAPEAIRGAGEVMAGQRGRHARIDADEQDADAGLDAIGKPQMFVVRLWTSGFRL